MWRPIETHLQSAHVARVTYGAIIGMALIVALERHPPTPLKMIATLFATALAVALAEIFSEMVGVHTRTHHIAEPHHIREALGEASAVAIGIFFPAVFFALAAFGVMEVETAFTIAKWSGLGLIAFYGVAAARLSGAGWLSSLAQASAVALVAAVLIAFEALLH